MIFRRQQSVSLSSSSSSSSSIKKASSSSSSFGGLCCCLLLLLLLSVTPKTVDGAPSSFLTTTTTAAAAVHVKNRTNHGNFFFWRPLALNNPNPNPLLLNNSTTSSTLTTTLPKNDRNQEEEEQQELLRLQQTQQQQLERRNMSIMIHSLVALSGMVETICMKRFKCFPNLMTGNTLKSIEALSGGHVREFAFYATMISMYTVGGALYKYLNLLHSNKSSLQQPQQNLFWWMSRMVLGLCVCSDVVGRLLGSSKAGIPVMAIAFGMVNAASMDTFGSVTNAVTSYWSKIGMGSMEKQSWILGKSENKATTTTILSTLQPVAVFLSSLLVTNVIYNYWIQQQRQLAVSSLWIFLTKKMPPMGICFGLAYGLLFDWFHQTQQQQPTSAF